MLPPSAVPADQMTHSEVIRVSFAAQPSISGLDALEVVSAFMTFIDESREDWTKYISRRSLIQFVETKKCVLRRMFLEFLCENHGFN